MAKFSECQRQNQKEGFKQEGRSNQDGNDRLEKISCR